jgi:hemerythrin-like domain-containing protein
MAIARRWVDVLVDPLAGSILRRLQYPDPTVRGIAPDLLEKLRRGMTSMGGEAMTAKTLDMVLVHRVFRRELHDVTALIDGVADRDVVRAQVVGDHLAFILSALHHHHMAEDELVWPKLQARMSASNRDIQRMSTQHAAIAAAVHRVEKLLGTWMTSGQRSCGQQLVAGVTELSALVDEHLDDEERVALPIIEKHLRDDEWRATIKRGASFLSARNLRLGIVMGGMVLDAASRDEGRAFIANMPLPQRLMVQLFGARTTAAYRRRLTAGPHA